jgi:hypothetical protein
MVSNIDKVKQEMIDQASFRPLVFSATSTNVVDSPLAPFGTKVAPSSMCRSRTGSGWFVEPSHRQPSENSSDPSGKRSHPDAGAGGSDKEAAIRFVTHPWVCHKP